MGEPDACFGLALSLEDEANPARDLERAYQAMARACNLGAKQGCAALAQRCAQGWVYACALSKR